MVSEPLSRSSRTARLPRPQLRAAFAGAAVAWILTGLLGVYLYGHRYWVYRGFAPPSTPAYVTGGRTQEVTFYSPALHLRTSYLVHLPAGYAAAAAAGRRFPVLYVLHGHPGAAQNVFQAGRLAADLDTLTAQHRVRPMILVLPEVMNGPFGGGDTEWADTPAGAYDEVVADVVHSVDALYSTRADRAGRVLAGLSSGAYAAVNVGLHHLGLFGGLQSWSGYFVQTRSGAFANASPALLAANSPELYVHRLAPQIRRLGLHAFLYVGSSDTPARLAELRRFSAALGSDGAAVRVALYPGGHDWALWRARMPTALRVANRWFTGAHR